MWIAVPYSQLQPCVLIRGSFDRSRIDSIQGRVVSSVTFFLRSRHNRSNSSFTNSHDHPRSAHVKSRIKGTIWQSTARFASPLLQWHVAYAVSLRAERHESSSGAPCGRSMMKAVKYSSPRYRRATPARPVCHCLPAAATTTLPSATPTKVTSMGI